MIAIYDCPAFTDPHRETTCLRYQARVLAIGPRKANFSTLLQLSTESDTHISMALELFIPPCIHNPRYCLHPPPPTKPLRIQIQGPLESIQKLLPKTSWDKIVDFPQPGGLELASLTHRALYGEEGSIPAVRDEYLAWAMEGRRPLE